MLGPTRPKHPDGERLLPYQSGNTAPPLHPLYKKHDSTIPKKKKKKRQEDQPDSRICQKPPEFLLSDEKNQNGLGEKGTEKSEGNYVKQNISKINFIFYLRRLQKVCISKIDYGTREWVWNG